MVKLNDVCQIICGATPSTNIPDYWSNEIKWATAKDVSESTGYKLYNTERKISKLGFDNCSAKMIPAESTVLIARGATMGRSCLLGECMAINQTCYALIPDREKVNPYFLFYTIKHINKYFQQIAHGAIFNTIIGSGLRDTNISLPPLTIQRCISEILSALDDKIELNRQTNTTLEAIAQTIFREWFIDFNYPGATGEMVESELGMIPKGWKVAKLGKILDVKGGTTPSTKVEEYWNGEYSFATPKDLSSLQSPFLLKTERRITAKGVKQISSGIIPSGVLLLSSRAPIGYIAISDIPVSINQGFIAINAKETSNLFILLWLKNNIETVISRANGSTFLEISKSNFREIKLILPNKELFKLFDELISPFFDQINSSEKQSNLLTSIRDALLQKLMNGEIYV